MTKKFIHTDKKINGQKCKSEFLIPDVFDDKSRLIGIKSKMVYDFGLVIYTGVDLDENKVLDKLADVTSLSTDEKDKYSQILKDYLSQIKDCKIGKVVTLDDNFKLIEEQ
ncbi:MAG: hypothetical protein KA713_09335 [Chryseotalea sp. WA131a]|jgi:hypothetical protein|nr:MAG: hypothetical protein KA713_01300 [Chryseotalea sp. WA131a]UXE67298.1 MAG: hypothetical protein KA713_01445 [Chryseotalea sp. WA131a]UXE68750.1 MAG: hypothetical protein KA713_09335 [Chryseotalea sp. WA131a]